MFHVKRRCWAFAGARGGRPPAAYFLPVQKVSKDTLRGCPPVRSGPEGGPLSQDGRPLRTPVTGDALYEAG